MTDALLVGLALLNANWDQQEKSYLDNFVPFVVDCLNDNGRGGAVGAAELQQCVKARFGIDLLQGALTSVLRRARHTGLVAMKRGKYKPTQEAQGLAPLSRNHAKVVREINGLTGRLVEFLRDVHSIEWSTEYADKALHAFVEMWSVPLLRQSLTGELSRPFASVEEEQENDYLISRFVVHLNTADPEGFGYLESLVKASMLTSGLYMDPGRLDQKFQDLTAYLDTPSLLALLGVNGESEQGAVTELVKLAKGSGVKVACFPDTIAETRGVLQGTARDLRSSGRGRRARPHARMRSDITPSELDELADRAERRLRDLGVGMRALPRVTAAGTTDRAGLAEMAQEVVGYASESTREHDVTCLAAVHQIRSGQVQVQFERARAIFVTTNTSLVKASTRHFGSGSDPLVAPIAVTQHEFATLLWLKKPTAAPDLPWKQLLADCHAALNPSDGLWAKFLDIVDELADREDVDENAYYLARWGHEARAKLMEQTRGRADKLNFESAEDVLEGARDAIKAPAEEQAATAKREAEEAQGRIEATETEMRDKLADAEIEGHRRAAEARVEGRSEGAGALAATLAEFVGMATRFLLTAVVGLVFAAAVWAGYQQVFGDPGRALDLPFWLLVASALASGIVAMTGAFGVTVPGVIRRCDRSVAARVEGALMDRVESRLVEDADELAA